MNQRNQTIKLKQLKRRNRLIATILVILETLMGQLRQQIPRRPRIKKIRMTRTISAILMNQKRKMMKLRQPRLARKKKTTMTMASMILVTLTIRDHSQQLPRNKKPHLRLLTQLKRRRKTVTISEISTTSQPLRALLSLKSSHQLPHPLLKQKTLAKLTA